LMAETIHRIVQDLSIIIIYLSSLQLIALAGV